MRVYLQKDQWDSTDGLLASPAGLVFTRRSTRMARCKLDERVAADCSLVLYYYDGRQLEWFDADDARSTWAATRGAVTADEPNLRGEVVLTRGVWEAGDGSEVVLLTGHC